MKPRVLFLDHAGVLSGAELMLLDVARYNAESGKVLLFADGPLREHLEQARVAVEVLPAPISVSGLSRKGDNGVRDLLAVPGVLKLVRRVAQLSRGYDLLYANSQKALAIGALAGKLANKPMIWHLHDMLTPDHFSSKRRRLATILANRAVARVIANSRASAAAFVEAGGRAENVRVIYNGIDPGPFGSVAPAEVEELKEKLGLPGAPIVSVFGRLAPWKGQHVLLEALARLPGVHALLVGEALFGESLYAQSLRELSKTLGVANRVHFVGFRRDVARLMRLSDVVVHTSISPEPFGRVIVEGMLACRPVVASRAGGVTEIVEDGVNGVLVPPGNPEALADALTSVLRDPSRRHSLAVAGYETASSRFSLRGMLEGVEQQIREVARPRRPRAALLPMRNRTKEVGL